MQKFGLIGSTLIHSKSPQIHLAAYKALGLDTASYEKHEISESKFAESIRAIGQELDGFNVTIPYKETIISYLSHVDKLSRRIGAVNTVKISGAELTGHNTDYDGFVKSLAKEKLQDANVAILGGGGAAKAVIIGLEDLGVAEIKILARDTYKVENSIPSVNNCTVKTESFNHDFDLAETDMLINATPVGQGRLSHEMPLSQEQLEGLKKSSIVYDLIYNDTPLLKAAKDLGFKTYNGKAMLVIQAAEAIKIWTGKEISLDIIDTMMNAFDLDEAKA